MQQFLVYATLALGLILWPEGAEAYIGPGVGAGVIATVLGVLAAIIMAFVAVLWYPLKRLFKRKARPAPEAQNEG